ncbi:MAG: family 78 glycoside hydrolase catalytic domain [Prevotella sp.]|nr:family 78 glycoside hydrolase catalytic domain [Prevotella sp.]
MIKKFILLLALFPLFGFAKPKPKQAEVSVYDLRVENLQSPLGIATDKPRFSWKISGTAQHLFQTGYRILVASTAEELAQDKGTLWDSGDVQSDEQLWIAYQGVKLQSNQRAYWKVCITTTQGKSAWSEPQIFGVGLLNESKWSGQWIGLEGLQAGEEAGMHTRLAARYLRREFNVKKDVVRATAYIAGLGVYELYINGQRIGNNQMLQPVPSDYRKTIYYNTFDVTKEVLAKGSSNINNKVAIGIALGNGRFFTMRQEKAYKSPQFGFPKCRLNILVEYADGSTDTWVTDTKWKMNINGPIRSNNEYDGEEYDARLELGDWTCVGYDDSSWQPVQRVAVPLGTLRGQMTEGMAVVQTINPISGHQTPDGRYIVDFGQNTAGMVSMKVRGVAGDTIRIRYAEKLSSPDTLYTANLRNAWSRDIYVCNGQEQGREWHSTFSYHGFRFIEVSGLRDAKIDDFQALVVSDRMAYTGQIETSDTILNKVLNNARWGILSNYKGMPVDCPQRNERQPWLGDRTVGSLGESFLFDNERLYTKWMRDICESQREDGVFCDVAPAFWNYYNDDVTWPAALPFGCEMIYRQYGNSLPIIDSYPYLKRWLHHLFEEYEQDGIITKDKYGDWCVPPEKPELIHSQDPARQTDGQLISTAYTIHILDLMTQFAEMQGLTADAQQWKDKRTAMAAAFNKHFLTVKRGTSIRPGHVLYPDSIFYGNNTATANLLPLAFGLVPDDCKEEVVKNVVTNIITTGNGHVTCGVIGISWLLRGLSDHGFADVAYLLATNSSYPSWGYMAEHGATTIWELWNGDTANPAMNSGNHVMLLGDLLTWCYQYLAGIRSNDAYKHLVLKPSFEIQDCEWVNASYMTPYGEVGSSWKKDLQHLQWTVTVPPNTTADVCLPDGKTERVGSGTYVYQVEIPTSNPAILKDQFLYEHTSFPQCHAGTIVETQKGDLVAAYFGGKHERNPDVCIWVNIKKKGSDEWSEPILAGDGVFQLGTADAELAGITTESTKADAGPQTKSSMGGGRGEALYRKACWNPVLCEMPNGELWLFYKIGLNVKDWTGWLVKSKDGGKTWGKREPLPKGFIGPVKNKPEIIDGRLLCGSSTEANGWKFHVEILDLKDGAWKTKKPVAELSWKYVGPIPAEKAMRTEEAASDNSIVGKTLPAVDDPEAPAIEGEAVTAGNLHPIDCIQPSFLKLADGRLQVLMRTRNGKLATSFSSDNGDTWTPVTLTDVPNNQSGTDAVTLHDGRHVLIYNDFETIKGTKKGPRTPVSLALSNDGTHWQHWLTLEDSPISQYSYPAIIEGKDGTLHCLYTWRRHRMAYKQVTLK